MTQQKLPDFKRLTMYVTSDPNFDFEKPLRLIRLAEVKRRSGMSTSTIYRWMSQGKFPRSRSIGGHIAVWSEQEIDDWICAKFEG